jgi:hypothetical protein
MSGPFGSSQWMYSSGGFYPTEIEQSLRFNDNDSAYLSRTPASTTNRKTWTYSVWAKVAKQDSYGMLLEASDGSGLNEVTIGIDGLNKLMFYSYIGAYQLVLSSSANLIRDPSAWYHFVFVADTTQATASERARVYINGERLTSFSTETYPSQNYDTYMNLTQPHSIGRNRQIGRYFDGYLAEVNFIDGQALAPTDFGEFKSGVWVAKSYAGSYGTNGFYLNFSDSANIGDDLSGNANDWTANNLVATDVVLDSPTQNWATLNAVSKASAVTLSQGNLGYSCADTNKAVTASFAVGSGKWYWEILATASTGGSSIVGIVNELFTLEGFFASTTGGYGYSATASKWNNSSASSYGATWTNGDLIGVALDLDAGTLTFYKNNVSQGVAFTGISGFFSPVVSGQSGTAYALNFGQDSSFAGNKTAQGNTDDNGVGDFYYSPPSGYLALCTANLPDPAIDPAKDDVPADYFNTVLWTGTDTSAGRSITGVGFQPDFVFSKSRNDAFQWNLYDSVRGVAERLKSNTTAAEETNATYGYLSSFDSDGFTTAAGATNNENWNKTSSGYVAWNWLAGNGTSSNTDGSISSTVSVNQKAGFSIVGYTGTGSAATVGHGLGVAPDMIIAKSRTNSTQWRVWHKDFPSGYQAQLNLTDAPFSDTNVFTTTVPTSSVFSIGTSSQININTYNYIAYCFAEVEGYSKFGSFVGNGSNDGPFVYTGFRPAFLMYKRVDATSDWAMFDTSRDPYNIADHHLAANLSGAEFSAIFNFQDILSNGFKPRQVNAVWNVSGGTYIYMAFAEMPAKYSLGR